MGEAPKDQGWRQESGEDLFGFTPMAQQIARQVSLKHKAEPEGAVIVAIEGGWGCGKSTMIGLLQKELKIEPRPQGQCLGRSPGTKLEQPLYVRFNAWRSCPPGGSAWQALSERIAAELYWRLRDRALRSGAELALRAKLSNQVAGWRKRGDAWRRVDLPELGQLEFQDDPRLPWREVAGRVADAVKQESWNPALLLFGEGRGKLRGRGLSAQSGAQALVQVLSGLQKTLSDTGAALASAAQGAQTLQAGWSFVGDRPPVNSQEFVEQLSWLLEKLGPVAPSGGLRLVVEIEDISRLEQDRLEDLLASLGYLEQLDGTLVVLALDRAQADKVATQATAGGEGALTRTLHLRYKVPHVRLQDREKLVAQWLRQYLEEPSLAAVSATLTVSMDRHAVRTPRMIKRRLWRLDGALRVSQGVWALGGPGQRGQELSTLELGRAAETLLLVQLCEDGFLELEQLQGAVVREGLMALPAPLWERRAWALPRVQGMGPAETELLLRLRWAQLLEGLGHGFRLAPSQDQVLAWLKELAPKMWGAGWQDGEPSAVVVSGLQDLDSFLVIRSVAMAHQLGRAGVKVWVEAAQQFPESEERQVLFGWVDRWVLSYPSSRARKLAALLQGLHK